MTVPAAGEGGFAVPVVAVAIALISLPLMVAANLIDDAGAKLRQARAQTEFEIAATSTMSRLAHLMLTEPLGQRSVRIGGGRLDASGTLIHGDPSSPSAIDLPVQEVVLDGRWYRVTAPGLRYRLLLSVQDEAGLLNINAGDDASVERALEGMGVDAFRARRLAGALADFIDEDDARRLTGAEARDYRHAHLPAPPNAPISHPEAAYEALGWQTGLTVAEQRAFLSQAAALSPDSRLNLNTAAPEVLRAVLGIDARAAQRIVAERELRGLTSVRDLAVVAGTPAVTGTTPVGGLPGRVFRIRIEGSPAGPRMLRPLESRLSYTVEEDRPVWLTPLHRSGVTAPAGGGGGNGAWRDLPQSPALLAAR